MTTEITCLDDDIPLCLEKWLKDERVLEFQRSTEKKIIEFLFSEDDLQIFQMLSLIGCKAGQVSMLQNEICVLNASQGFEVIPCGLRKSISKATRFLADHKTEIFIGAALCATGLGIAAVTGYACSFAVGGVVVAGAGSVFSSEEESKRPPGPPPASQSEIALYQQSLATNLPKLEIPVHTNELLLTTDGIWADGRFFSNQNPQMPLPAWQPPSDEPLASADGTWAHGQFFPDQTLQPPKMHLPPNELLANNKALANDLFPLHGNTTPLERLSQKEVLWSDSTPHGLSDEIQPNRSRPFLIEGKNDKNLHISWINGVWNTLADSKDNARYIQNLSDGFAICGIYNCTHGRIADIAEAGILNHSGFSPNTAALLQAGWENFHEANKDRPNAKLLQSCHSQGAIHVRNALMNSPPDIRDRVIVIAIAPGAVVPKRLCFRSYNYASEHDSIYKLEPSNVPITSLTLDDVLIPTFGEPINDRDELIILPAHPEAASFDHAFQSPTYREVLERAIEKYLAQDGEYLPNEKGIF